MLHRAQLEQAIRFGTGGNVACFIVCGFFYYGSSEVRSKNGTGSDLGGFVCHRGRHLIIPTNHLPCYSPNPVSYKPLTLPTIYPV